MKTAAAASLAAACLLLGACAGTPVAKRSPDASPCLPGSGQCAIYDFAMADEIVLRANGESITVDCPLSLGEDSAEQRRSHCEVLVKAALGMIQHRFPQEIDEIRPERVRYEYGGDCVDTLAPKREGEECEHRLQAQVPLPWVVLAPGETAAIEPELR